MNTINYQVEITSPAFSGEVIVLIPDYVFVAHDEWHAANFVWDEEIGFYTFIGDETPESQHDPLDIWLDDYIAKRFGDEASVDYYDLAE
ncbi:MAG: hypothetical protein WA804_23400 [Terriglobales bacterium]